MAFCSLKSLLPSADELLALEVEELAGVVLEHLKSCETAPGGTYQNGLFHPGYLLASMKSTGHGVPTRREPDYGDKQPRVDRAVMEAWAWLEKEGFLVRDIEQPAPWFWMSRRGQRITSREDFEAYRKASLLPKGQLHPLVAAKVYPAFLRGEYDTAIFQAFREIEVAVRGAGNLPQELVGDKLMRAAFAPAENNQPAGPLADAQLPVGEQRAMSHLFAGAFGLFRNSTAHRYVPTEAKEGAEVVMFASQLMRIVDRMRP
jgi:uncharacterized protein (TIGR02391 family)